MEETRAIQPTGLKRALYLAGGLLLTGIGIIGVFVPLMPTTIFLILAVACFARSSTRLERWLLDHPQLGPPITRWRDHGAIAPWAKTVAVTSMAAGVGVFWFSMRPSWPVLIGAATVVGACAAFVLTRPSGPRPVTPP